MVNRLSDIFRKGIPAAALLACLSCPANAQEDSAAIVVPVKPQMEKNIAYTDSAWTADSLAMMSEEVEVPIELLPDSLVPKKRAKRDWATWKPNAKKAMWLALVIPGAGQIYNRKYWKLPIIYGGFVGCAYAMRWNNMMYRDYSQAY